MVRVRKDDPSFARTSPWIQDVTEMSIRRSLLTLVAVAPIGIALSGCGTGAADVTIPVNPRVGPKTALAPATKRTEAIFPNLREARSPAAERPSERGKDHAVGALRFWKRLRRFHRYPGLQGDANGACGLHPEVRTWRKAARDPLSAAAHRIDGGNHLEKIAGGSVLVLDEDSGGYRAIGLQAGRSGNQALSSRVCAVVSTSSGSPLGCLGVTLSAASMSS